MDNNFKHKNPLEKVDILHCEVVKLKNKEGTGGEGTQGPEGPQGPPGEQGPKGDSAPIFYKLSSYK